MYLDPGFGSMIIQLLVAGFAVLGGFWVAFRKKLKNHFKKDQTMEKENLMEDDAVEKNASPASSVADITTQKQKSNGYEDSKD